MKTKKELEIRMENLEWKRTLINNSIREVSDFSKLEKGQKFPLL